MKSPRISIKKDGMSTDDKRYMLKLRIEINAIIHELELEYNKCLCNSCRIQVINKMDDIVSAELYKWFDTLEAPLNAGENLEMDAFDNSLNHIAELQNLLQHLNNCRKELLNS